MSKAVKNLSTLVGNYETKLKAMKDELSKTFENEFKIIFGEIFTTYPNVKKISWAQYTPYFNDGDACIFSVNSIMVLDETVEGDDDDASDVSDGDWVDIDDGLDKKRYPLISKLNGVLQRSDDILLQMFGDHVSVVVTPEGMNVEEYQHD